MPKNSTLVNEATAEVTGLYLNKYQEIVKPNQRFLVSNYFIHYWLRKLGPTLAWIIVSLQQACWRADNDICTISQTTIGDEIGLTDRTIRKVLKKNPFRHWFIPEIQYQPGTFDHKKKVYQPLPNKYTVYLSSPLIPEHLAGLYGYLRTVCPNGQPGYVDQAITDLLNRKSKESLVLLEEYAQTLQPGSGQEVTHTFDRPIPLAEVVTMATGLNFEALPQATAETLTHNLDRLQAHLTEIGNTICRQYFRLTWVPLLGPALAWLVMIMRSRGYYNPETEELRDTCIWRKKELAELLGQSTKNLSNLLAHPYANLFCQILDQNKRKITVRVNMVYEPLAPEEAGCVTMDNQPLNFVRDVPHTSPENRKNVPVTDFQNKKIVPVTPSPNRKNVPVTDLESEKCSGHSPQNRKNVPPCKYFKKSVLTVDDKHEDIIQNNNVVVDKSKEKIKKLLENAGLSGTGLSKLCHKNPPLDPQQVQAVILYADANNLGPGYIYRHLERDDNTIDELFMQFATLDDETLVLFQEAVNELRINGTFAREIQTPIPEDKVDLFAKFAEIFAGIEASRVSAILRYLALDEAEPFDTSAGPRAGPIDEPERDHSLDTFWQQVLGQLQLQMTEATFDTWVKDTRLIAKDGLRFTVAVKSGFAKDWLENRLFSTIRRTIVNLVKSEDYSALRPPKGEVSNGQEMPDVEIDYVVDG